MKKVITLALLVATLNATNLKSMLHSAKESNNLLKSNYYKELSAKKGIEAINRSYRPTVEIGALAQDSNPRTPMRPGVTYSAFVKLNYLIYDGNVKKYTKRQKVYELSSIKDANKQYKYSLYLQIVQDYYDLLSLKEIIRAFEFKKRSIAAQYDKMKKFKEAGLIGEVELYQLEAALENVKYNLNSLDLQKKTLLSQLSLKVGKTIKKINYNYFKKQKVSFSPNAQIRSLQAKMASLNENAKAIKADNNPKVNLSLEHNEYDYGRTDKMHPEGLSNQTTLTLSATMKIYDGGVKKQEAQAMKLQAMSLSYELKHSLKEQKINYNLSKARIDNIRVQIKSAKASLKAAQKNYNAILKKYNAGIIDNTEYLDALSNLADAKANYKKSLNDLDVAYAIYYYNAGRNIVSYIR